MDEKIFAEAWRKRKQESLTEIQKFWDLRAEEFNKLTLESERKNKTQEIIDFLQLKNALHSDYKVLDIGCGAGKFSIAFAEMVQSVTGIDISPKMISFSKRNMAAKGMDNGEFYTIPWQTLDIKEWGWEKKFDLVFASMSPAIHDAETLLKMNAASRKHCFMSGFVYREDQVKSYLIKKIAGKKKKQTPTNIYYAFNILWKKGFYPEVVYRDHQWEKSWTLEQAVEIFTYQLQGDSGEQTQLKDKVRAYLKEISSEGMVEEKVKAKIAWLYWQVPSSKEERSQ